MVNSSRNVKNSVAVVIAGMKNHSEAALGQHPTNRLFLKSLQFSFDLRGASYFKLQEINAMPTSYDATGAAALAICKALLLALKEQKVLPEKEIVGLLMDAAAAHQYASPGEQDALHLAVARLINSMIEDDNWMRRIDLPAGSRNHCM